MKDQYIYTEKNDCQDCYRCIRECPVKAIHMEEHSASIIQENCVYCGHCITVCPVEAKKVKEDVSKVKFLAETGTKMIASLAPSWASEFEGISPAQMTGMLERLGFDLVSETALGAEIVSSEIHESGVLESGGLHISACCPSVVELIQKYYPHLNRNILSHETPMLAHGRFLRDRYGDDIKIVFIGPCIAKKKEADLTPGIIDAVITFKRLKKWFREEGIVAKKGGENGTGFQPDFSANGSIYPVSGGMVDSIRSINPQKKVNYLAYSGMQKILPILASLEKMDSKETLFLELLACPGGCVNGPGSDSTQSLAQKELSIRAAWSPEVRIHEESKIHARKVECTLFSTAITSQSYPEYKIKEVLKSIGKGSREDEMNCSGCGYETCRDFSAAILDGKAERSMCVTYMRKLARDKVNVLLHRMPYGVVIIDRDLRIVESNRSFAVLAGNRLWEAYDKNPGLEGADLREILPFYSYFENLFRSGESSLEKDIPYEKKLLHLSVFTLEGKNMLCAMLHNLRAPEMNRAEIVRRTRKVITENLQTVQKIAFHLGENASNMETLLNSIVDIQEDYED